MAEKTTSLAACEPSGDRPQAVAAESLAGRHLRVRLAKDRRAIDPSDASPAIKATKWPP